MTYGNIDFTAEQRKAGEGSNCQKILSRHYQSKQNTIDRNCLQYNHFRRVQSGEIEKKSGLSNPIPLVNIENVLYFRRAYL